MGAHNKTHNDLDEVKRVLESDKDIAVVAAVHHETGTGVLNPIKEIGQMAHDNGAIFIVDTISTYGLRPINIEEENVDFVMSSAKGSGRYDRCFMDSWKHRCHQEIQRLSCKILLLQSFYAVRFF